MTPGEYTASLISKGHSPTSAVMACGLPIDCAAVFASGHSRDSYVPPIKPPLGPPRPTKGKMIMASVDGVALRSGLERKDLLGRQTARYIAWPRQEAMYVLRTKWGLSLPRIGQLIGGRHHTTVLDGIRRYEARLARERGRS